MKNNKTIWILFGILQQISSWIAVVVYTGIKYGTYVESNGVILTFGFSLAIALWLILRSLKDVADNGYGLWRKIARGIRLFIPLLLLLMVVLVLNKNIAGIVDVILFAVVGNLVAIPLGVISYYASPQYIEDTSANHILQKLN